MFPKASKTCPISNKSPNLVTLVLYLDDDGGVPFWRRRWLTTFERVATIRILERFEPAPEELDVVAGRNAILRRNCPTVICKTGEAVEITRYVAT